MSDALTFLIEVDRNRSHHVHVTLSGDLVGGKGDTEKLRELGDTLGLRSAVTASLVIYAEDVRLLPDGARAWLDFVETLPSEWQLIYQPSQLSMIMEHQGDAYVARHPTHVHVDNFRA